MMRGILFTALCLAALSAAAETLRFEGVLGNSGELDRPVTFGSMARETRGIGAAYDAARGALYSRAGSGTLNAYALDGRLLAQYRLPTDENHRDAMALCGGRLVMLLGGKLYRIGLGAPDGAAAEKIETAVRDPEVLSASARAGRVAVWCKGGRVCLLDPADGAAEPLGEAPGDGLAGMDWDAQGALVLVFGKVASRLVDGRLASDAQWPKRFAGEREAGIDAPVRLGDFWYGSAWHGTVKRFTAAFEPAPGVILGGASGHFIGHVAGDYDVDLARGLCEIAPGLFAIGGLHGVVQLAEWQPEERRMRLLRRIGALPVPGGLAVDSQGRVLARQNIWNWKDDALAPAAVGQVCQMLLPPAFVDADTVVGLADVYGKTSVAAGKLEEDRLSCNRLDNLELPEHPVGVALYREQPGRKGAWRLLVLGGGGQTRVHDLSDDLRNPWRACLGAVSLQTAVPVKAYTAVAMKDPETLLAAADGQIVEFARDGAGWKEATRWSDGFGQQVRLSASAGRVAVADAEKNRVALYALADRRKLAEAAVASPTEVAVNGEFLVAYDSVGQRLMKYRIEK